METQAIRIHEHGGTEVMCQESVSLPAPGAGEVLVKNHAIGVNFIDVYHRTGLYPVSLPSTLGMEAAGEVVEVGTSVDNFSPGSRVGYCVGGLGSYSEYRVMSENALIALPDDIDYEQAAAVLLKGMTVEYLIRRLYTVRAGDTVLWHAAAGGVGLIACQWLKQIGATVIGTAGDAEKAELAKSYGCQHVVLYNEEDTAEKVREITEGKGVVVAYDSVGQATFEATLNSLSPRGMFVSFGNASGAVEPFPASLLAQKGSLFFTRPTLMSYCSPPEDIRTSADALFFAMRAGLHPIIGKTLPLSEAAEAHRALESRETRGATVMLP